MAITYQLVTPEQFQEAIELYNTCYLPYDPVLKAVGCTVPSNLDRPMVLGYLKQGLSWCAVDKITGKMVGIRISHSQSVTDLTDAVPTFDDYIQRGWSRAWSSVWVLFSCALDFKKILTTYQEDKMMELFALCVHPDYKKRGIATELVKRNLDHAVKHGHTFAGVLCTSAYTQQLYEKQGFEKVKEVCYATYVDTRTNSFLFKDVEEPHKAAISYVKKLC